MKKKNTEIDRKIIKFRVSDEEDTVINEITEHEHITRQHFIMTRLFDTPTRSKEHSQKLARRLPIYYNLVAEVNDQIIKDKLLAFADELQEILKE